MAVNMEKMWDRIISLNAYDDGPTPFSGAVMTQKKDIISNIVIGNKVYQKMFKDGLMTDRIMDFCNFYREDLSGAYFMPKSIPDSMVYVKKLEKAGVSTEFFTDPFFNDTFNDGLRSILKNKKHKNITETIDSIPSKEIELPYEEISSKINRIICNR